MSVTVGEQHSCTLLKNGTVECWGANGLGELGDGSTRNRPAPAPVHGTFHRAVMVSAGFEHTCALVSSGDVECWGANRFGQLGDGGSNDREAPVRVQGLHGAAVAISAGGRHTCAVLAHGEVECWGADYSGQLGNGRAQDHAGPVRVRGVSRAVSVSAGRAYTCAVERAGAVKCWGANAFGQLGNGTATARRLPTKVHGLRGRAVAVSAAQRHTCAVLRGGGVACWGANESGQLGDGSTANSYAAVAVDGLRAATTVTTGIAHTCALTKAGGVRCWGMNASGELGGGTLFQRSSPLRVTSMAGAAGLSAGGGHTCARTGAGVSCWGANYAHQLGDQSRLDSSTPVRVHGLSSTAASIAAGDRHTCVVTKLAEVVCWGANDRGQLGDGSRRDRGRAKIVRALASHTARMTAGESHTCALSIEGDIRCWGANGSGQLGNGTFVGHRTPSAVVDLAEATDVSAGGRHTCAVTTAGAVECWGANDWGQLGTPLRRARSRPWRVEGLAGPVTLLATGDNHTCALTEAGVVECWGANDVGQLGSSATQPTRAEPARVHGLPERATEVTSGANHTCALMSSGRVRCWGANDSGQLGNGAFRPHNGPVTVRGLSNAIAVSAGGDHTCALTKAGELLCWGWNYWGQLGDGAPPAAGSSSPVHVVGL